MKIIFFIMSEVEIRRELKCLLDILAKASEFMKTHTTDDNFRIILISLADSGVEMVKMIKSPAYRSHFDFDGWYQMNVFYALEEIHDYFSF